MPTVIAYHDVKNRTAWLASKNRQKFFGNLGVTGIREFTDPQNLHRVGVLMEVPDLPKMLEALQTPEAAQAMAEDGVVAETVVLLVAHN